MAQYFTDFSEYVTDSQPSDWTVRWDGANSTWVVKEKAGTTVLEHTATTNKVRLITWNDIDADAGRADAEILAKFRTTAVSGHQFSVAVRASGAAGSETAYRVQLHSLPSLTLNRWLSGSISTLKTDSSISFAANTWYWLRVRVSGNPQPRLQVRYWADGASEPGTWNLDHTDTGSAITEAGWVGVGNGLNTSGGTGTRDFDLAGIGTSGDSAPSSTPTPPQTGSSYVNINIIT